MQAASAIRREAFRRTRRVAIGVLLAGTLTFVAASPGNAASADSGFEAGRGSASAFGIKVNPVVGGLSFGVTTGVSIAGHQNTGAQGQSQAIDLGVIGVTLAGEGCRGADPTLAEEDQPQPVIVFSGDPGAEQGVEESEGGIATKFARATLAPYGEGITTILPAGDPLLAHVTGGRTTAFSGVMDGDVRQATAITEIGGLSFVDGIVELRGMRWEATHRSGSVDETIGTFTFEGLFIGGQQVPFPEAPAEQAKALNDALRPLGFTLTLPEARVAQNIVFVDPLRIGIVGSEARDDALADLTGEGGLLGSLVQDAREALFDALLEFDCTDLTEQLGFNLPSKTIISVFDIVLSSTLGGGSNTIELGGVQATTSEIVGFAFPGAASLPDLPPPPPAPTPAPVGTGSSAPSATGGAPSAAPAETPSTPQAPATTAEPETQQIQTVADLSGSRGGWLALVGAAGLLLLLASAEGDRRKMRRALREIPVDA